MSDIKIKIDSLYKIFGKNPKEALEYVKQGVGKDELLEKHNHVLGLSDINIDIEDKSIQVIMGLSGSGKSTLIRHINRLIEPTAGNVLVDGNDVLQYDEETLRNFRRERTAMVFQRFALMPHMTILKNVSLGLELQGKKEDEILNSAMKWIEKVGLNGYEDRYPQHLSGGMQQRVGLARALTNDTDILLMDEAFSALDPLIRKDMQDILLNLQDELHKTVVFITHDLDEAIRIGNRIAIMKDGRIIQIGTPEQIVTNPADDYVRDFVEGISKLKLVYAHSIMDELTSYSPGPGEDLLKATRVSHDTDLDTLIDISVDTGQPIVVKDDAGAEVGVINRTTLLRGIKGGKA